MAGERRGAPRPPRAIGAPAHARERWLATALAVAAALRVFVFASAYPPFNGVDEHQHFDAVVKWAHGVLPGPRELVLSPETVHALLYLSSPEYLRTPSEMPGGRVPTPEEKVGIHPEGSPGMERGRSRSESMASLQHAGPPLYYVVAGAWYRLGRALGLGPRDALYFVRWLDAVLAASLVVTAYAILRRLAPGDPVLRLGVPALLAFFPNDFQYSITNDALSPLVGAGCFGAFVAIACGERVRARTFAAAGALVAAAFLNKYSNLFLVAVGALACAAWARGWRRRGFGLRELAGPAALAAAAALPALAWVARNALVVGSATGQHRKIARAGWTWKPVSEWIDHPIFTGEGFRTWIWHFAQVLWSGEIAWAGAPLRLHWLDAFYAASTLALVGLATAGFVVRQPESIFGRRGWRPALDTMALAQVGLGVGMLGFLSILFRFGHESLPSDDFPYFASGRYVATILLPFAVLYVRGLEVAAAPLPEAARRPLCALLLAATCLLVVAAEAWLAVPVFRSPWNWFHAP